MRRNLCRAGHCWKRNAVFPRSFMMGKIIQALTAAYKQ